MFTIRNCIGIALLAMSILAAYFLSWQIVVVMALPCVAGFVWLRGRSSRSNLPPG
jgi:general stress protein CsbA